MDIRSNNELSAKLMELQKRKKELKEKLNTVCDKENRKKMIIQYLEEEEEDK
jgi:ABC-type phosphate transport system auxiliary subunit